jgi:hypothetical protein
MERRRPFVKRFGVSCPAEESISIIDRSSNENLSLQDLDDEEIEVRYGHKEFPGPDNITFGSTIKQCWNEEFETAGEVVDLEVLLYFL